MSWATVKIGDLCTIEKGQTGIKKAIPGVYPLVVTSEERKSHNEFQFDAEAVIIPLVSGTGHGHASIKRIHYQTGKFALGSILCAVIPKDKTVLNPEYLFRFLELNKENELVAKMRGMANVTLPLKEIAKIQIPLPPLKDQIAFVKSYKILVEKNNLLLEEFEGQLDLLKQLRQSFLREAMEAKLVNSKYIKSQETGQQLLEKIKAEKAKLIAEKKTKKEKELAPIKDDEISFDIPDNWTWCRFGEVCSKIGSGSTPKGSNYSDSGRPFFRSQNIHDRSLIYEDIKFISDNVQKQMEGTIVLPSDILLNITGGSLGRCALVPSDFIEGNVSQHVCIIRPISLNNNFLHCLILSPYFQKMIFSSTTGAGREGLPKYNLEQFVIPLPPLYEQQLIAVKLEELMKFCDSLEKSIKESQVYNDMLLQQVLREALQPKEEVVVDIDSLFEDDKNYNLHVAMIQTLIESQLGINHGEVANQKTIFHINAFTDEKIPYQFVNHHFGTFSQQLRDDFNRNPYLTKTTKNNKDVFIVKPAKQKEILDSIYKPENKNFVNAVKEILDIYELPFINKETDKIELLNTVSKVIVDTQSDDLENVYSGMQKWAIKQNAFKTKADKFSKTEVSKMITLISRLGLVEKLLPKK